MKKKAIYIYLLIFCLIGLIFSGIDNLNKGYYLFFTSTHVVNAYVIKKETRDTSEGTFFDYQTEFKNESGATIRSEISLWSEVNKEYQIGDVIKLLVSIKRPKIVEALSNLNVLRFKQVITFIMIFVLVYSTYKLFFSQNKSESQ